MKKTNQNQTHSFPSQPVVLIAGAAGFLGSHLAENLVAAGFQVIGLDNLSTGNRQNLTTLSGNPNFDLIKADISQGLPPTLTRKNITHVVAAAGVSFYLGQEKKELQELLLASLGIKNLLDLAVKKRAVFLLLSSIDIYKGVAGSLSLEHYYDQLEAAQQLSFLEGRRYAEALTQQYSDLYDLDARVARLSWVYGPRMNLESNHVLARLIRLTLDQKDLILDEDGSMQLPLLFIKDAVYGLTKFLLGQPEKFKKTIFNFFNPEPVSILSIAYTLKEHFSQEPQVEFLPKGHKVEFGIPSKLEIHRTKRELLWEPQIDLTTGVKLTLEYFRQERAKKEVRGLEKGEKEIKKRLQQRVQIEAPPEEKLLEKPRGWLALRKKQQEITPEIIKGLEEKGKKLTWPRLTLPRLFLALFLLGGLIFGAPLLGTAALARLGMGDLQAKNFESAQNKFLMGEAFWGQSARFFRLIGQKSLFDSVDSGLTAAFFAARSAQSFYPAATDLKSVSEVILNHSTVLGGSNQENVDQAQILSSLKSARLSLEQGMSDFSLFSQKFQAACDKAPSFLARRFLDCEKNLLFLNQTEKLVEIAPALLESAPKFLGWEGVSSFLILLQNNTEVRATGGFLGSYLVIDFDQGRLTRFKVDDIYNPDGILKQKITAPAPVQKYMDVVELGIRDANWWPHFPESAEKIATLYEFATNEKVSLVLALNLEVVKSFLQASGEIFLPDYQETITLDNLFERAEVHAEVNFEPGSTKKRDFLGNLSDQLLTRLIKGEQVNWILLGQSLLTNLTQKDILIYSREVLWQKEFVFAGWAGEVKETSGDYLWVVDSNVGGNKANFWVARSLNYGLDTDRDGNLIATLKVNWKHTGVSETWPGGPYKNFLRVYTPLGSSLLEQTNFSDEVITYEEFGKTVLGGLVQVPINSQKQVTLKYRLAAGAGFQNSSQYSLLMQKQGGLGPEEFTFQLNLPVFLELKEGKLQWTGQLLTDVRQKVLVQRK